MSMKESGRATRPDVREWAGGFAWMAHPEEQMRRASHALDGEDGVWLVDPVAFDGLDQRLAELGDVAGVVVLLDRHTRDAAELARRHDVTVHAPPWIADEIETLPAPIERIRGELGETGYRVQPVIDNPVWHEGALWDGETLVVPEAVGSSEFFCARGERLGVHPVLRLLPPRRHLRGFEPERVLTGHGMGVFEDGTAALETALSGARRRAPALYLQSLRAALPG